VYRVTTTYVLQGDVATFNATGFRVALHALFPAARSVVLVVSPASVRVVTTIDFGSQTAAVRAAHLINTVGVATQQREWFGDQYIIENTPTASVETVDLGAQPTGGGSDDKAAWITLAVVMPIVLMVIIAYFSLQLGRRRRGAVVPGDLEAKKPLPSSAPVLAPSSRPAPALAPWSRPAPVLAPPPPPLPDAFARAFRAADANGDGVLNRTEFSRFLQAAPTALKPAPPPPSASPYWQNTPHFVPVPPLYAPHPPMPAHVAPPGKSLPPLPMPSPMPPMPPMAPMPRPPPPLPLPPQLPLPPSPQEAREYLRAQVAAQREQIVALRHAIQPGSFCL
jgi:hypothetical protein